MRNKLLKILFVSRDKYPPFRVDVSVLFGKEMARKGHRIDLVLQSEANCKTMYQTNWDGGKAWVYPTNNGSGLIHRIHKHLLCFFHSIKCIMLLSGKKYNCIQMKDNFVTAIPYILASRLFNTAIFYWLSYPFGDASIFESKVGTARYPMLYYIRGKIYNFILYKIIFNNVAHIFVQSMQMKKDLVKMGVDKKKITPIPMGFDPSQFPKNEQFYSPQQSLPNDIIVYLGTLMRVRKIDFLIRVFSIVKKKVPNAKLYLIGKGEDDQDIEILINEAKRLGILSSIVFTGFMDRTAAFEIIKSASVCLSPFYPTPILSSTSPTKLVEYLALGKSVVANDHPEQKEVIEKSGGGICVSYNESDFAGAVIYLLTHNNENIRFGIYGKKWIYENRTYSKIADQVESIYYKKLKLM